MLLLLVMLMLLLLLSVFLQSVLLPRLPMLLLLAALLSCGPLSLLIMILLLLLILLLIKSFLLAVHTPHDDISDTLEVTPIVLEHCNNDAGCHYSGPPHHMTACNSFVTAVTRVLLLRTCAALDRSVVTRREPVVRVMDDALELLSQTRLRINGGSDNIFAGGNVSRQGALRPVICVLFSSPQNAYCAPVLRSNLL